MNTTGHHRVDAKWISEPKGLPRRKNVFDKHGDLRMCLADLRGEYLTKGRCCWALKPSFILEPRPCFWWLASSGGWSKQGFLRQAHSWGTGDSSERWQTQKLLKDCSTLLRLHGLPGYFWLPPSRLHLEAEVHGHLMAWPLLASSFPTSYFTSVPWIKILTWLILSRQLLVGGRGLT